jgi:hypothetical protein
VPFATFPLYRRVGRAARRIADNQAKRPRRIALRPREARHDRERGSARGQMQKMPTVGKFHLNLPPASHHSITSSARAFGWADLSYGPPEARLQKKKRSGL